jgi:hypothetical protein
MIAAYAPVEPQATHQTAAALTVQVFQTVELSLMIVANAWKEAQA